MHGLFYRFAAVALISVAFTSASPAADPAKPHHIAIQVDQNDPQVMNLALGNANNAIEY